MDRFQRILLNVWREVCRHIEILECTERIGELMRDHLPLEELFVFWFDREHHRLLPVAAIAGNKVQVVSEQVSRRDGKRLEEWMNRGRVCRFGGERRQAVPEPVAMSVGKARREILLAPLAGPHGTMGFLAAVPPVGLRFTDRHLSLMEQLQEPFGVALDNDRRLHELAKLREAAEADRQSLLTRLGRRELADSIVGESSGLRLVMERVRQIARSDVPVLILGETGTGKELIARAIHNSGERSSGPFIRVNCGAIAPDLIDSHLFGHDKGSFTGATETRQGWFERADGGTLFLDEIGELPPNAQVRFLRVLQDGLIERVGGNRDIPVDVRVVAATHRDLAAMAADGKFREDLWYRIAVFPILLPPLRDRKQDIPALANQFAQKAATRFGLPTLAVQPSDLNLLLDYDWPGNIRELGAVIDRAAILGEGRTLEIAAALGLPRIRQKDDRTSASGGIPIESRAPASSMPSLNQAMRMHIEAALTTTRGRIEGAHGAAKLLQINPHTLRARMKKLGIDWSAFREKDDGR